MHSWASLPVPSLPGASTPPLVFDTAAQRLSLAECSGDNKAGVYVCGITPYDATHLGHAATYIAFDTLQRVWRDAGYDVRYVQNVTDIDDPLLERATATGVDWRDLAAEQTQLFRDDMESLRVLPPDEFIAVSEVIDEIADAVEQLVDTGYAYSVPAPSAVDPDAADVYFDIARAESGTPWRLGQESNYDADTMLRFFAERGGDPDREGKRNRLDPLLWLAARPGEPSWPSRVGSGRPGWHVECSVIALRHLGDAVTVQGGGSDLIFPHHEMSAGHASALTGKHFACIYSHTGMVAYQGEKMSKSLGNLVLVSRLRERGVDPRAIRLAVLAHHYRSDWEWTDAVLDEAIARLARWQSLTGSAGDGADGALGAYVADGDASDLLAAVRKHLGFDLDTPSALDAIDDWVAAHPGTAAPVAVDLIDALLGIDLAR
ncbi:cysteine--1-D-myo-inosityl 2-amino-2-deoxy-alpha-D-glucopyranoside ligase [Planctomonas psychrotolerans]|uniref:cysteine--1-D-myo-inosityl 2-amino-2-deoxy-alpha-D-glucopyranoside ligase n=1 Tax=Planctomonas psychrotolerans TaxID=2528712 RepID=UPI00123C594B|nr:cysteine--1-D-myo-inosityl 2-amino-2-deoxy-alpha-D-glucopyranoside ligase [Planctomonas psychrotolerans]